MEIYNVGSDVPYDLPNDDEGFVWLVYYYESGYYDGSGEAVALAKDGKLHCFNLGHCSCYGPMDSWPVTTDIQTVEEFFRAKDNILDFDVMDGVKLKVAELLGLK